ncbi:MAG: hypothetical protein ABSD03_13280 [Vulcanimicrobiaceae bacterium]|jgi:hypothetical protein
MNESPPTVRPDLIGKTIVCIADPQSHGEGKIPPKAVLGEIIAAESEYAAIRYLRFASGHDCSRFDRHARISHRYERYEPGELLETYMPGFVEVFGRPDFVLRDFL